MRTKVKDNLLYTKEHEWVQNIEPNIFVVGITDHAQCELGDIVFIELPKIGKQVQKGKALGVVESVKAVSDIYAPIDGEIIDINETLSSQPEKLNQNPYETWIVKIRASTTTSSLLDAKTYHDYLNTLES